MSPAHKSWLSPLLAVTSVVVAVTGLFLAIHYRLPGVHALHLWGGALFVVVAAAHLMLNWREFANYFKKGPVLWSAAAGVLVLILVAVALPSGENADLYHHGRGGHHGHVTRAR